MDRQRVTTEEVFNVLVEGILASINHGGYGYGGGKTLEGIHEELMAQSKLTIPTLIENFGLRPEEVINDILEMCSLGIEFIEDLIDPPPGKEPKSLGEIAEILARAVNEPDRAEE